MLTPVEAVLLGVVEGLTEYLPISSTGHLILAARALQLQGEAIKTFEIVIQSGAIAAVLGLYQSRVAAMWRGLRGADETGRRLLRNVLLSFFPAAAVGLALHEPIKAYLFRPWPVVWALALGGIVMILLGRWIPSPRRTLDALGARDALVIGLAQCLALWPGTSRAMVTMVAGMALGLPAAAAAEYSFLLALPTLGAATLFDMAKNGGILLDQIGVFSILCGFITAAVVAAMAIRGLMQYLGRHGLAVFGWYRLALAAAVWWAAQGG